MFPSRSLRYAAGALALLSVGFLFAGNALDTPFLAMGRSTAEMRLGYIFSMSVFLLSGVGSSFLSRRLSSQLRLLLSTVLTVSGVYIASFSQPDSLSVFYIGRVLLFSSGVGLCVQTVLFTLTAWAGKRKWLCACLLPLPVVVSAFLAAGPLCSAFSGIWDWRSVYRLYALILGVLLTGCMLFLDAPESGEPPVKRGFPVAETVAFLLSGAVGIVLNDLLCV